MRDGWVMARMLAVVLRAIWEAALVCLAQKWVERLVLAGAEHDRAQAEGDNIFESLDGVRRSSRLSHVIRR